MSIFSMLLFLLAFTYQNLASINNLKDLKEYKSYLENKTLCFDNEDLSKLSLSACGQIYLQTKAKQKAGLNQLYQMAKIEESCQAKLKSAGIKNIMTYEGSRSYLPPKCKQTLERLIADHIYRLK